MALTRVSSNALNANAVTAAKIADGTIAAIDIADGAIFLGNATHSGPKVSGSINVPLVTTAQANLVSIVNTGAFTERANVINSGPASIQAYTVAENTYTVHTANATNAFQMNFTGLANVDTNNSVTFAIAVQNGSTAYYPTSIQVDGVVQSSQYLKWQGTVPGSGNPNSIDVYTFAILKLSSGIYRTFASQSKFV
jgi:uncharacterized protein (UPF0333 family)